MTDRSTNLETNMNCWDDEEREEGTLTRVEKYAGGDYSVTSSNGWSCGVSAEYGVVPKLGDAFVTWGIIGLPIRGQALNGIVLYYRTPDEEATEHAKRIEKMRADRIAEYEGKRSDYDARVLALPVPLRERVEAFRAHGGDEWRWNHEPYEMACCEEAARLVAHFKTAEAIKAFHALDSYEAQKAEYPEMDSGHSGNTWGTSLRLAHALCETPESVPKIHAAMCALTGCEECGCFAAREKAAETHG